MSVFKLNKSCAHMAVLDRRAKIDAEIRRCRERLGALQSTPVVSASEDGGLAEAVHKAMAGNKSVFQSLDIRKNLPVLLAVFAKLRGSMATGELKDAFSERKEAFTMALQLRTQVVTLGSMIQNFAATHAALVGAGPSELDGIIASPLSFGEHTLVTLIIKYLALVASPVADGTDENARAVQRTLTRQRRLIMRQLVGAVVLALQLADEKGVKVDDKAAL